MELKYIGSKGKRVYEGLAVFGIKIYEYSKELNTLTIECNNKYSKIDFFLINFSLNIAN